MATFRGDEMRMMKAYKFRSSSQLPFALDIIFNHRLYCSDWRHLNDPMEGMFTFPFHDTDEPDLKDQVASIVAQKERLRVCSLAKTFKSHLLWAHYASGFDGIAIEVEIPRKHDDISEISYGDRFATVSLAADIDVAKIAKKILSSKYKEWEYEQEVRILQHGEVYRLTSPVKHIIAGHRINPALFQALRIICESQSIVLSRTRIDKNGIKAESVPQSSKDAKKRKTIRSNVKKANT